jgi:thymidylate kinase
MKKKVIIFEGLKGTGKTMITQALKESFKEAIVYGEEITLLPIKHCDDKNLFVDCYEKIINRIDDTGNQYFFIDRFYFTKWRNTNYESDYFVEIEKTLLSKFEVILIFLKIDQDVILQRLKHTQNQRKGTGWKLNYDGKSIEDEAKKDVERQKFFLDHLYKDTLIPKKMMLDTTDLPAHIDNLDMYIEKITKFIAI